MAIEGAEWFVFAIHAAAEGASVVACVAMMKKLLYGGALEQWEVAGEHQPVGIGVVLEGAVDGGKWALAGVVDGGDSIVDARRVAEEDAIADFFKHGVEALPLREPITVGELRLVAAHARGFSTYQEQAIECVCH